MASSFGDGTVTGNGGALALTGESSASIFNSTFVNNTATGKGGAVYLAPTKATVAGATLPGVGINGNTFDDNQAQNGGALAADFPGQGQNSSYSNNTFTDNIASHNGGAFTWVLDPSDLSGENFSVSNNVVVGNKASGFGGGGYIVQHGLLRIDNERYEGNSLDPTVGIPPGQRPLRRRALRRTRRHHDPPQQRLPRRTRSLRRRSGENYGGAGVAMFGADINIESEFTRYESNTLAGRHQCEVRERGRRALPRGRRRALVQLPRRHSRRNSVGARRRGRRHLHRRERARRSSSVR